MIRFGRNNLPETEMEFLMDGGEFGLAFRRQMKLNYQTENGDFIISEKRKSSVQQLYMRFIIPQRGSDGGGQDLAHGANRYFPHGDRPKKMFMENPRHIRVNGGTTINIADATRKNMLQLAAANNWNRAAWQPHLDTAVGECYYMLQSNDVMSKLQKSDEYFKLFERLIMPGVTDAQATRFAMSCNVASPAVMSQKGQTLAFVRYAKAAIHLRDVSNPKATAMMSLANQVLNVLREQDGLNESFAQLERIVWNA